MKKKWHPPPTQKKRFSASFEVKNTLIVKWTEKQEPGLIFSEAWYTARSLFNDFHGRCWNRALNSIGKKYEAKKERKRFLFILAGLGLSVHPITWKMLRRVLKSFSNSFIYFYFKNTLKTKSSPIEYRIRLSKLQSVTEKLI